ncbi:MAG: hypothetical protein JSS12_11670, partial [Verrucomicrobia bacterium]|nr:hypothetical protein [Verrucomicrobiota bacterium]
WDVDDAEEFERLKTVPQESAGCNDFQLVALKLIEPKVAERLTVEQALEQLQQTKIQKLAKSGCAVQ